MQLKTDWLETFLVYFFLIVDAVIDNKYHYLKLFSYFRTAYILKLLFIITARKKDLTVVLSHFIISPSNRGKKTSTFPSFITFFFLLPTRPLPNKLLNRFFFSRITRWLFALLSLGRNAYWWLYSFDFHLIPAARNDWPRNSTFNCMIAVV